MNEDRIKGKAKDVAGRVERQVGEWTGDTQAQTKGAIKQVEGKAQNAWGKAKDAAKDAVKKSDEHAKPARKADDPSAEEADTLRRRTG
jgi:uncharacterized protein YjbJ (UPF0337 family)